MAIAYHRLRGLKKVLRKSKKNARAPIRELKRLIQGASTNQLFQAKICRPEKKLWLQAVIWNARWKDFAIALPQLLNSHQTCRHNAVYVTVCKAP